MSTKYVFQKPYYNVVQEANDIALEEAYNVYFEAIPSGGFAIRRRPGTSLAISSAPYSAGSGIYWSHRGKKLFFVRGDKIFKKESLVGSATEITNASNFVHTGLPVVFAESQLLSTTRVLYFANGTLLNYTGSDDTIILPSPDAATPVATHICNLNNRIFANVYDTTAEGLQAQDFFITDYDPGEGAISPLYWSSAVNPFRAAQKPDRIIGVYSGWGEAYLWGSQACEVWQEDGVTPVSPLVGSLIEVGLVAPYSVCMTASTMFGLGTVAGNLCVVAITGRTPTIISEPIAQQLQSLRVHNNAIGSMCYTGGVNLYILTFPADNVTWVYDIKSDIWSKWSTWDVENGVHNIFTGKFGVYAQDWNKHYIQAENGEVLEISRDYYSDNGTPIRSVVRTGWIDHGTYDRKRSDQLIIKLKGYSATEAKIGLRWRSDGFKEWSTMIELPIQYNEQNDSYVKLNRMGIYRSRQYEFVMTDAADMALVGLEEDVIRLRN